MPNPRPRRSDAGKRRRNPVEDVSSSEEVADVVKKAATDFRARSAASVVAAASPPLPVQRVVARLPAAPPPARALSAPSSAEKSRSLSQSGAAAEKSRSPSQSGAAVVEDNHLDSALLSSFGGFDHGTVAVLEDFFSAMLKDGDEDVVNGLQILSVGMKHAIEAFTTVSNDFHAVNSSFESACREKVVVEQVRDQVVVENERLKVAVDKRDIEIKQLRARLSTVESEFKGESSRLQKEVEMRDAAITDLKARLARAENETAKAKAEFDLEKAALEKTIADFGEKTDNYASVLARFSDPVTAVQRRCPLIQNNGVIQSILTIIEVWVRESDMGQSHAFRMFTCPVKGGISMLSPVPILDAVLKVASAVGINTSLPVVFFYRGKADNASWVEFPFHEQLELIARLCSIYRERHNTGRPPEQRSVAVQGGSAMLSMRAIALMGTDIGFQCFGMHHDGSGQMDIKVVLDPEWAHPFDGMVFPSCD